MEYLIGAVIAAVIILWLVSKRNECEAHGHQPPVYQTDKGWGGTEYGKLIEGAIDGIGRVHCDIKGKYARCGKEFLMAKVHLPELKKEVKKENI